jgi:hypothetical protein
MIRPDRQALAYFVARPVRISWLLLPLMGFECVMSERPLVPFEDGFVDVGLVGHWYEQSEDSDDTELEISLREDGMMEIELILADEEERPYYTYRGYAARLGEDTYANLELLDISCLECGQVEFGAARAEFFEDHHPIIADTDRASCTFIVIQYEHTEDDRLVVYWQDSSGVKSALEQQQLAGRIFAEDDGDLEGEPCITATAASLSAWIAANTEAMFSPADSSVYLRRP